MWQKINDMKSISIKPSCPKTSIRSPDRLISAPIPWCSVRDPYDDHRRFMGLYDPWDHDYMTHRLFEP